MFANSSKAALAIGTPALLSALHVGCAAEMEPQDGPVAESENDLTQRAQSAVLGLVYGNSTASAAAAPSPVTWRRSEAAKNDEDIVQLRFAALPTKVVGGRTSWALAVGSRQKLTYFLTTKSGRQETGTAEMTALAADVSLVFARPGGSLRLNVAVATDGRQVFLGGGVPDIRFGR
jgi:hypothetical protein